MNPTELLVKKFSTLEDINGEVVPVSYKESAKIAREIEGEALLMMGLAAGRKEISLERFAWNERKASIPDNDGILCNGEKIDEEGEERLETTVDIIELEKRIKDQGIPVKISTDPGRYVCNNIYYTALSSSKRPSLFVHFPLLEDMDKTKEEKALEIILDFFRESYCSE